MRKLYFFLLSLLLAGGSFMHATNLVVNNSNDTGPGSLRQHVQNARPGDVILFHANVTSITLLSHIEIPNGRTVTIKGGGTVTLKGRNGAAPADQNRIFDIVTGGTLTLDGLTLTEGMESNESGGAIANSGTLTIVNSTFYDNKADMDGGAIWNNGTLTAVNSTFYDNKVGSGPGGAIYNKGTLTLLNSILTGNTAAGREQDIYLEITGGIGTLQMAGCIYGEVNGTFTSVNNITGEAASVENVFGIPAPGLVNGMLPISATGTAAYKGTLTGYIGSNWYYRDGYDWKSFSDTNEYDFDPTLSPYGLENGTVITTGQNGNVSRIATYFAYNVGAYALPLATKTPSLVVNSDEDVPNPFDASSNTLREAVAYAFTQPAGSEITFAAGVTSITLLRYIDIPNGKNFTIKGGGTVTLKGRNGVPPADKNGIFYIATGGTLTLDGLAFTEGKEDMIGFGAIGNDGTLTVLNSTFYKNESGLNGGAIESQGALTVVNSTFYDNEAFFHGGAIYNDNAGTLTVVNSTFYQNEASDGGGAIYSDNAGTLTVVNSTFYDNKASDGGAIYNFQATARLLNSILTGNTASTGKDIYSNQILNSANLRMAGCVYGEVINNGSSSLFTEENCYSVTDAEAAEIFANPISLDAGMLPISPTGVAAYKGTLTGYIGSDWYYRAGSNWKSFTGIYMTFDPAANDFDLQNGIVIENAQNSGVVTRTATHLAYNAGAYALPIGIITDPLVVDSDEDNLNPFDTKNTLREAVAYNATQPAGTITFDNSVTDIRLLSVIDIPTDKTVAINGGGTVTLRGQNGANKNGIFNLPYGATTLTLDGLALTEGSGAIVNWGILTVSNSTFYDNNATGSGGAIENAGTLTVINSTFYNNNALNGVGGAIYNSKMLTAVNSTFYENKANFDGGAIYNDQTLMASNCTFYKNEADLGGAIYSNNYTATLLNSILTGNTAISSGQDIYLSSNTATLQMAGCIYGDLYKGNDATFTNINNTTGPDASVANVFGANPTPASGMLPISASGAAVLNGTLTGYVGNNWYFRNKSGADGDAWYSFAGKLSDFNEAAAPFGLTGGTVIENAQNGESRTDTHIAYNAGAYALAPATKTDPLLVTANGDTPNPFDASSNTLREAVEYANSQQGGGTITIKPGTGNITLGQPPLNITEPITITGQGELIMAEVNDASLALITLDNVLLNSCTVTFNTLGGSTVAPLTDIGYGSVINAPANPTYGDYAFGGWYKEATFNNAWVFGVGGDEVKSDITLYAKWQTRPTPPNPRLFNVIIGETEGASTYPAAGEYQMAEGALLVMQLFVSDEFDKSTVSLLVNDQPVEAEESSLRAEAYIFRFPVTEDLKIEIVGVKHNDPIGTEESSDLRQGEAKVWTSDGRIYIQTSADGKSLKEVIRIYSLTGQLIVNETLAANGSLFSTRVPRGLYIVTAGNKTFKVSVGK